MGSTVRITVELAGFSDDAGAKAILSKYLISAEPPVARLIYEFRPKQALEGKPPTSVEDYEFALFGGLKETRLAYDLRNYIQFIVLPALRDAESELSNWRRSPLRRLLDQSAFRRLIDPRERGRSKSCRTLLATAFWGIFTSQ